MSGGLAYRTDTASAGQIAALLRRCDSSYVPPLSTRVDLDAYAVKIASHALRLEAWRGDAPVALLAMYCNDIAGGVAYVTNVSVAPDHGRQGIASALLADAHRHAAALGLRAMALEVDGGNQAALRLYQQHGYVTARRVGAAMHMSLNLHTGNGND